MNLRRICSAPGHSSQLFVLLLGGIRCPGAERCPVAQRCGDVQRRFARRRHRPQLHTDAPLGYSIAVDGKPVLLRSRIGLELAGDVSLGAQPCLCMKRGDRSTNLADDFGKDRDVRDRFNELTLTLKDGNLSFGVVARAYNDGAAFRLTLPRQPGMDSFTVTRDATEFTFPGDERLWAGWNNAEGTAGRRWIHRIAGVANPASRISR